MLEADKFGKILGIPFWRSGSEEPFWRALYQKIKIRMASWSSKSFLTIHARVQLANLICYGIPRYWIQSMLPPPWFNKCLKSDIDKLLWDRQIEFDPEHEGSTKHSRAWMKSSAIYHPKRLNDKGEGLGLGLIDWESHCSAIRISWLFKYRDATDAPWKNVLDAWFANTIHDRGAIFTTLPSAELTAHLDPINASIGITSHLSKFWKAGLEDLRNKIKIVPNRKSSSRAGVEGYPVWHNPFFTMPTGLTPFKRIWEHLGTNTLDDLADAEGSIYDSSTLVNYLTEDNGVKKKTFR